MIRRPRFPLTLRLAWMESELNDAASLLPSMISDAAAVRRLAYANEARIALIAHLVVTILLTFGLDPQRLAAFVTALGPEGDLEQADVLAAELLAEVMLRMSGVEGEGD